MTCPCGRPLDMGVDHGDTETGDPICKACCPDCNPKGPQVTDPAAIAITYMAERTDLLTRGAVEDVASGAIDAKPELVEACKQHLADNPAPLTREQLDRLPPGTRVGANGELWCKASTGNWYRSSDIYSANIESLPVTIIDRPQGVFVPLTDEQIHQVADPNSYVSTASMKAFRAACREAAE